MEFFGRTNFIINFLRRKINKMFVSGKINYESLIISKVINSVFPLLF